MISPDFFNIFSVEEIVSLNDDVLLLMQEFTQEKPTLLYGSFLINRLLGKVNVKLLNRLWVNMLCAEDSTKRKKTAHLAMKILQKIRRII